MNDRGAQEFLSVQVNLKNPVSQPRLTQKPRFFPETGALTAHLIPVASIAPLRDGVKENPWRENFLPFPLF